MRMMAKAPPRRAGDREHAPQGRELAVDRGRLDRRPRWAVLSQARVLVRFDSVSVDVARAHPRKHRGELAHRSLGITE